MIFHLFSQVFCIFAFLHASTTSKVLFPFRPCFHLAPGSPRHPFDPLMAHLGILFASFRRPRGSFRVHLGFLASHLRFPRLPVGPLEVPTGRPLAALTPLEAHLRAPLAPWTPLRPLSSLFWYDFGSILLQCCISVEIILACLFPPRPAMERHQQE